jgi:hypothetical protein
MLTNWKVILLFIQLIWLPPAPPKLLLPSMVLQASHDISPPSKTSSSSSWGVATSYRESPRFSQWLSWVVPMVVVVIAIIIEQKSRSWRPFSMPRTVNVVNTDRLGTALSSNLSPARRSLAASRTFLVAAPCPSRASALAFGRLVDVHGGDLLLVLVGHGVAHACV